MAEYIDREAAVMRLMQDGCSAKNVQSIMELPAADVAPVVYGRWKLYGNDDNLGSSYFCSKCGANYDEDYFYKRCKFIPFNFCPNCGAKME